LLTLLNKLFKKIMKGWSWVLLIVSAIAVKWISLFPSVVEKYYTGGLYPVISKIQRILFGWIPFSIGDLFYGFLILVILVKTMQFIRAVVKKKLNRQYLLTGLKQVIFFFLFVYVFFYGLWGLNYSRKGIAHQLGLKVEKYSRHELDTLTTIIVERLNQYAARVTDAQLDSFRKKKRLFTQSHEAFKYAGVQYPFLKYSSRSLKPSLYSYLGNYLGFQGYYNPFTGEGQVNTTVPPFIEPFVACHEIGHQLGYARENEANFVAFLACRNYPSDVFRYSLYFDLYYYAVSELYIIDSAAVPVYDKRLHPLVKKHQAEYVEFYKKYRNPVEPIITAIYSQYLKANNQPEGKRTYNRVIAWLVAYYKKYGAGAV